MPNNVNEYCNPISSVILPSLNSFWFGSLQLSIQCSFRALNALSLNCHQLPSLCLDPSVWQLVAMINLLQHITEMSVNLIDTHMDMNVYVFTDHNCQ